MENLKNLISFKEFSLEINENKNSGDLGKSFMDRVLGITGDKKIEEIYKNSPRKLAKDLLLAIKRTRMLHPGEIRRKAQSMIELDLFSKTWPSRKRVRNLFVNKTLFYIKDVDLPGIPKDK
jgi:hypothetical protein